VAGCKNTLAYFIKKAYNIRQWQIEILNLYTQSFEMDHFNHFFKFLQLPLPNSDIDVLSFVSAFVLRDPNLTNLKKSKIPQKNFEMGLSKARNCKIQSEWAKLSLSSLTFMKFCQLL
jgi:hypothetical protein